MTSIEQLIAAVAPHIPFASEPAAQAFLNQYSAADQAALISALYIGRDHIHDAQIRPDYLPKSMAFDRFFHTGSAPNWDIPPADFAGILYKKNTMVATYYAAFIRCMRASGFSLNAF